LILRQGEALSADGEHCTPKFRDQLGRGDEELDFEAAAPRLRRPSAGVGFHIPHCGHCLSSDLADPAAFGGYQKHPVPADDPPGYRVDAGQLGLGQFR
jgi:hypothetical protein